MSTKVGNVRFLWLWPIQITQSIIYKQQDVKMIYVAQPYDILNPYLLGTSEVNSEFARYKSHEHSCRQNCIKLPNDRQN